MTAPRGKGVEHLVSDLATLSTSERQTGSGRGTPWSNTALPKTKPTHIDDKRGPHNQKEFNFIKKSVFFV
jgi:hypothetical protein